MKLFGVLFFSISTLVLCDRVQSVRAQPGGAWLTTAFFEHAGLTQKF